MIKSFISFLFVCFHALAFGQEMITISGHLKDGKSGEALLYTKVSVPELNVGSVTNEYGFFSFQVPKGDSLFLRVNSTEHPPFKMKIATNSSQQLTIEVPNFQELEEVVILAKKSVQEENVTNTEVSTLRLEMKQAKKLPALGGETDVLKVAQLLPGINRGTEGSTDFFVRGGDGDQNLILVDEATVYNPGHLFGFFSVFNPDVIKEMTLYKGGFPANYGGRLSSITDIRIKEGNKKKIEGEGGIGMLSSRLTLQVPIWKDKMSLLVSGRRTYIDKVLGLVGQNLPYYFYDLNGKFHYNIDNKNKLMVSSYYGNDVLRFGEDASDSTQALGFGFQLGNFTQTAQWTHVFNGKLFSNLTFIHSRFRYDINGQFANNNILIKSSIRDLAMNYNFTYFQDNQTKWKLGIQTIGHGFRPNIVSTSGEISEFLASKEGDLLTTLEIAPYVSYFKEFNSRWNLEAGVRLSSGAVKNKFYGGVEPRANLTRVLTEKSSLKASASRMMQYMHRVSSSSISLPTDLWYPVTQNVKPQISDQIAASFNQYLPNLKSSIIVESYYKHMQNLTEYREGSNLILNDNFEDLLLQGTGWSSGLEFLFKKEEGKLTGWLGYTLSWTKRKFDELNNGEAFWAKYDRRHYFTAVMVYDFRPRISFSAIFDLSTGARFTPIIGQYFQPNAGLTNVEIINIYAKRNSYRMATSHRLDVNFVFKSKPDKKFAWEWHVGAYNLYNRATPFQIQITQDESGKFKYTQPGLFGFIPSFAFNFKF